MKIRLEKDHREHLRKIGHRFPLLSLRCTEAEYKEAAAAWKRSGIRDDAELHKKVIGHLAWKQKAHGWERFIAGFWPYWYVGIAIAILLLIAAIPAHCQFSKINSVTYQQNGTTEAFITFPHTVNFAGCTVVPAGSTVTVTCTGSGATNAVSIQSNNVGSGSATTQGQFYAWNTAGLNFQLRTQAVEDARDLGIDCTGATDASAILAAAASETIQFPNGCLVKIVSNTTVASTVVVQFGSGSELVPSASVVVIVNGSPIAGDRQQIVNTANGTVSFYGRAEIPCGWYGALQDGVHDDAPGCEAAHNANPGKLIYLTPINPHCVSGSGGGCVNSTVPDALFLSQFLLHANGSTFGFKGSYHKIFDGGPWISVPNTLNEPAIFVGSSCGTCSLRHVYLKGPNANQWNQTNLTTFMLFSSLTLSGFDNDGITIAGSHFTGEDIGAENFLRHGILLCGDNSCQDSSGDTGQVDYWYINGSSTVGNRGFGIFTIGGDGGGGKCINCGGFINSYGAIGDYATGNAGSNTWDSPGDEFSARDAILAGTTQAVTSISVAGTTCTLTTTAALANGVNTNSTWIVVAGSTGGTNFNGTFQVTSFNNVAQTLTYPCAASSGPASGGTVGTQSSRGVWNYLSTVYKTGSVPINVGYPYCTGQAISLWIAAYVEPSGMGPCAGGAQTMTIAPQMALGTMLANQLQSVIQSNNNGLQFGLPYSSSGSNATIFGLGDSAQNLILQNGITSDQDINIKLNGHSAQTGSGSYGSTNWLFGQWLTGRYFRIDSVANNAGDFFLLDSTNGTLGLSSQGSGDVVFNDTAFQNGTLGSGNVKFFGNSSSVKLEINANGSLTQTGVAFASLPASSNGTLLYCTDCKNVADDSVTFDSTATGSGHGTNVLRENGVWRVH